MRSENCKASIIIINFNGGELLTECVKLALETTLPVEVLVGDNDSHDGSIIYLRKTISDTRLKITENGKNLGFATANNRLIPQASGEFLLFLNPDCLMPAGTLEHMIGIMEQRPDVGMAGCLIRNLDGSEQPGCRRKIPTPFCTMARSIGLDYILGNRHFMEQCTPPHQTPLPDGPVEVEALSGAFMLVRRKALEEIGLWDEGYFLHCEDLDLCMRFHLSGWKIIFVPDVSVVHAKGRCSLGHPVRVEWHKHRGMIRFYKKFLKERYPLPLMWLVFLGVWVRFAGIATLSTAKRIVS